MNKVLVVDEKKIVIGNNAVKSAANPLRRDERREQIEREREKKQKQKRKRKQKKVGRLKILGRISMGFMVGMLIMGRYAIIYQNQYKISQLKTNTSELMSKNENYKLQLMKIIDLKTVEKISKEELGMSEANRVHVVLTDLSKNNFISTQEEKKEEKNFFAKFIELLF